MALLKSGTHIYGNLQVDTYANVGANVSIGGVLYITNTGDVSANLGSFEAYANTKIGTNTNSNLVIVSATESSSITTGALVVAGGAGVAGNVTAANVFATGVFIGSGSAVRGLFWSANNAAVSTGGSGTVALGAVVTTAQGWNLP